MNFFERTASLLFDGFRACAAVVAFGFLFKIGDAAAISETALVVAVCGAAVLSGLGYLFDYFSRKEGKYGSR